MYVVPRMRTSIAGSSDKVSALLEFGSLRESSPSGSQPLPDDRGAVLAHFDGAPKGLDFRRASQDPTKRAASRAKASADSTVDETRFRDILRHQSSPAPARCVRATNAPIMSL